MLWSALTPAREEIGLYTLDRSPNQLVADDCNVRGRAARGGRGGIASERARRPNARRLRRALCRVCRRRCARRRRPSRVRERSHSLPGRLLKERSGTSRPAARAAASLELGDGERGSSSIIAPSAAGLSPRDPWLCAPASRRVCLFGGWSTRTSRRRLSSRDRDAVRLLSTLTGPARAIWRSATEPGRMSGRSWTHVRARKLRAQPASAAHAGDIIGFGRACPLRSSIGAPLEPDAAPHFKSPSRADDRSLTMRRLTFTLASLEPIDRLDQHGRPS